MCLISNGIKYTKIGGVTVSIELYDKDIGSNPFKAKKVSPPKYNIMFKVKDTGIGIDDEKAEMMRSTLSMKLTNNYKSYKMCGFALIISKHICNLHDGFLWFESLPEVGTIFYGNIVATGVDVD